MHVAYFFSFVFILSLLCVFLKTHTHTQAERVVFLGYAIGKRGGETLYPTATLASHSTSCLPASLHIQSCPAVNGHTHTHTDTHSFPVKQAGRECHPPLAQSFFIGVKVSDSFRVLQTDDYIWSQLDENSQAVCSSF